MRSGVSIVRQLVATCFCGQSFLCVCMRLTGVLAHSGRPWRAPMRSCTSCVCIVCAQLIVSSTCAASHIIYVHSSAHRPQSFTAGKAAPSPSGPQGLVVQSGKLHNHHSGPLAERLMKVTCSLACAMSRATTRVPVRLRRVRMGNLDSWARISDMGLFRST